MGTSIFLIFIIPFALIYGLLGNLSIAIFGEPQTEIALPYDESQGIVWEYDNKEDYYIDLVETKIEGNKQIFVFQDFDGETDADFAGGLMDLIFTDKNGNQKKYYACLDHGFGGPLIYEENECLVTEYTAVPVYPHSTLHWEIMQESDSVLVQPTNYGTEVTFTVVCTPGDISDSALLPNYDFTPIFSYEHADGGYSETVAVEYTIVDGKLVVEDESRTIVKNPDIIGDR